MVNIVGAGLAGLSAASTLARQGVSTNLISVQPSERAQSVLAEGGINAALDTMGEGDSVSDHYQDTIKGGCFLESEESVKALTENAPQIVRELINLGVPFNAEKGKLVLRNFGGQKKKRTAFAKSSTGKMIMTALIDEARKYEALGVIKRYPNHEMVDISISEGKIENLLVRDIFSLKLLSFSGPAIICCGGLNGFFEGMTTGTTANTGNVQALLFEKGVEFANLEFIQYHPTTVEITGKRLLVSEAARGEGGRLFTNKNGTRWYFMEEKYPEFGNLMPRDVVSREMFMLDREQGCDGQVYLDMTEIGSDIWDRKLNDLRKELIDYIGKDPKKDPIPVSPGMHYFMGGIRVNRYHETNIKGLYAAGEAAARYHGANRLGGNSMLGAIFGGKKAAENIKKYDMPGSVKEEIITPPEKSEAKKRKVLKDILSKGLGIVRTYKDLRYTVDEIEKMLISSDMPEVDRKRAYLGLAMVRSALERKESRGAHFREDYPEPSDEYRKQTVAVFEKGDVRICFKELGNL